MFEFYESMDTQVVRGKAMALKIHAAKDLDFSEQVLALSWVLAKHYGIPLFSDYFANRTPEELVCEVELIRLSRAPSDKNTTELLNSEGKEAKEKLVDDMFGDWIETDNNMPELTERDKAMFGDFMKSGEFK